MGLRDCRRHAAARALGELGMPGPRPCGFIDDCTLASAALVVVCSWGACCEQGRAARALAWLCYLDDIPRVFFEGAAQVHHYIERELGARVVQ